MVTDDASALLLFIEKYRNLWVDHQTLKLCSEHTETDPRKARSQFLDAAVEIFLPVERALLDQQPVGDVLRDAFQKL